MPEYSAVGAGMHPAADAGKGWLESRIGAFSWLGAGKGLFIVHWAIGARTDLFIVC